MAGVTGWNSFEVVLMLGLGLPKRSGWGNLGHNLSRP
jgi:hypothetical protein